MGQHTRSAAIEVAYDKLDLVVVKATDTGGGTGFATLTVVVPKSSSNANIASVNAQAAAAKAYADGHGGAPPAGYFLVGDGAVIGSKQ